MSAVWWGGLYCWLFGHDYVSVSGTIEHFDDNGMRIMLEDDLDCRQCGKKVTVTTDCT